MPLKISDHGGTQCGYDFVARVKPATEQNWLAALLGFVASWRRI
jgi:hypothetical protein